MHISTRTINNSEKQDMESDPNATATATGKNHFHFNKKVSALLTINLKRNQHY